MAENVSARPCDRKHYGLYLRVVPHNDPQTMTNMASLITALPVFLKPSLSCSNEASLFLCEGAAACCGSLLDCYISARCSPSHRDTRGEQ